MLENASNTVLVEFMAGLNEGNGNRLFEYYLARKGIEQDAVTYSDKILAI